MPYEQKEGDIAVFHQRNKKNPKGPDITGTLLWKGEELEVALWTKRDGGMYAGKVQHKREKGEAPKPAARFGGSTVAPNDDPFGLCDIPF